MKRYRDIFGVVGETPTGDWVKYDDAMAEIERLRLLLADALAVCPKSYSDPIIELLRDKAKKEGG